MSFANYEMTSSLEITVFNTLFIWFPIPWFPNDKNEWVWTSNQALSVLKYEVEHSFFCCKFSCPYGKGTILALKLGSPSGQNLVFLDKAKLSKPSHLFVCLKRTCK